MALARFDPDLLPGPRGFLNFGSSCYLNSLAQALISCPAFAAEALASRAAWGKTRVTRALHDLVEAALARAAGAAFEPHVPFEHRTQRLFGELLATLRRREPGSRFGHGQQSASEAFVLLLDMATEELDDADEGEAAGRLADLFTVRYLTQVNCPGCAEAGRPPAAQRDSGFHAELFHAVPPPAAGPAAAPSAAEFAETVLRRHVEPLESYRCEACGSRGAREREYHLERVPPVLVAVFDLYDDARPRRAHFFPPEFELPAAAAGATHRFRQVAQVEHFGQRGGGHYVAKGLRRTPAGPAAYELNDASAAPAGLGPTPNVYLVFYHST